MPPHPGSTDSDEAPGRAAVGSPDVSRMSRDERRDQVLAAAMPVVAAHGFAGVTTDQVARAAGVSQPYVVRMFGGKAGLLLGVFGLATQRLIAAFEDIPAGPGAKEAMAQAYVDLVSDRDLLLVMLHGFAASADPDIGALARRTLSSVLRLFRERTGGDVDASREFVAHGMLINVMMAVGAWEHRDEDRDLQAVADCILKTPTLPAQPPKS